MNLKKVLAFAAAGILTVCLLAGCGADNNAKKTITMGTESGFAPFEVKEGENVIGIDPDIATEIAKAMDAELKIEDMNFDGLVMALSSGKVDFVAAGMTIDPEKDVDFSEPYFSATQVMLVRKEGSPVAGVADVTADKKVGVQLGTTGDDAVKDNGVEPQRYEKFADAVMDLKNSKLDVIVMDSAPAAVFAKNNPELVVLDAPYGDVEEYGIAVKKGNKELLDTINKTIKDMKESGKLDEIIAKYND